MNKKILTLIILIGILAAGVIFFFVFQKPVPSEKTLYVLWTIHIEGDKQGMDINDPVCYQPLYQTPPGQNVYFNNFERDVEGTEALQREAEKHKDSFGGQPKFYLSFAGEFFETEIDLKYGNKAFRTYDWLELGHEIGIQGHGIYWSGKPYCWPARPITTEGIKKKLTTLNDWANKWFHNDEKVNAGWTYAPGIKQDNVIFGGDKAKTEEFLDKEASKLGYKIANDDWSGCIEDNPTPGQRPAYLYQAQYEDGAKMYKVCFEGPMDVECQPGPNYQCETPENAKQWINKIIEKMKSDNDPTHLYYYDFTTHATNFNAGLKGATGEYTGALEVLKYFDQLVTSGVKIKYITPKDFVALLKELPTSEPSATEDSPFGFLGSYIDSAKTKPIYTAYGGFSVIQSFHKDLGVYWNRGGGDGGAAIWGAFKNKNTPTSSDYANKYTKQFTDFINTASVNGINLLITIIPTYSDSQNDWENGHKVPGDIDGYTSFVKEMAQNYPTVKHWQLYNEINDEKYWHDTPENYAKLLRITSDAIKGVCPDCKIVLGSSINNLNKGYSTPIEPYFDPLIANLSADGKKYFDVFDYHFFPPAEYTPDSYYKALSLGLDSVRNMLNKYGYNNAEIWITETMIPTTDGMSKEEILKLPAPYQVVNEKQQAKALFKTYILAFSKGVKKVFWNSLTEGPWFDFMFNRAGLIRHPNFSGSVDKKLSYYTYKKMAETLEGSDWNNIQKIQESGGIYIYKFTKQGKPIWVAWNDNSASKQIIISSITSNQVKITEAVPKYESGKDVTDYNTAFNTEAKFIQSGKITIMLEDVAVFLEEK